MKFSCDKCSFGCDVKQKYDRHLLTRKHINNDAIVTKGYSCSCGKSYKYRQGLYAHKLQCTHVILPDQNVINDAVLSDNDIKGQRQQHRQKNSEFNRSIIERLLDQNSTLIKQLACMAPGSYNNNSVNSHNKTFNLQIFLNEDCKDAMNMSDFINSVTLQLVDLESVGELGYVDGISNIFLQKLNALDMYKRPIHCTDLKRYTMHIKDADQWQKDDDYRLLKQAIKRMSKKNSDLLLDWKQAHAPQNDRDQDTYLSLIIQSMGGGSHVNLGESEVKIIKRIAKGVMVDKV